jgi:hypothetical protein
MPATNSIENMNGQLRKIIKTQGHFPSDEATTKLIWLALRNITADWGHAAHDWKAAMNQLPSSTKSVLPGHPCDAQPASNTEILTGPTTAHDIQNNRPPHHHRKNAAHRAAFFHNLPNRSPDPKTGQPIRQQTSIIQQRQIPHRALIR